MPRGHFSEDVPLAERLPKPRFKGSPLGRPRAKSEKHLSFKPYNYSEREINFNAVIPYSGKVD